MSFTAGLKSRPFKKVMLPGFSASEDLGSCRDKGSVRHDENTVTIGDVGVGGGEGGEVVGADDVGCGLLQGGEVEGALEGPDVRGEHRGADMVAGEDAVLVGLAAGAVAGVEVWGDFVDGEDSDAWGEDAIEGSVEVGAGDWIGEGDGGYLS